MDFEFLREIENRNHAGTRASGPRLIYADWLEERGDPRAELLRLEDEVAEMPATHARRNAAQRRLDELIQDVAPEWLFIAGRTYDLILFDSGHGRRALVKWLARMAQLPLLTAKTLLDQAPVKIMPDVTWRPVADFRSLVKQFPPGRRPKYLAAPAPAVEFSDLPFQTARLKARQCGLTAREP